MKNRPLVSVVTPAYNSEKYIAKLLDSVLSQTYSNIEMIVVDDGSIDNTKEVVQSYIPFFKNRNFTLQYTYQENRGQSVALNKALKLVKGDYLVWPDSDDYYHSKNAIERMVDEFDKGSEKVGIVRTQERIIRNVGDKTIEIGIVGSNSKPYYKAGEIFEDCLYGKNFYFSPGGYMIKMSLLRQYNGLDIYTEKDAGQNWQLMLPMLYRFDCITIMEPLFNVLERPDSHSRGQYRGYEAEISKTKAYMNTLLSTLEKIEMPQNQKSNYQRTISNIYIESMFTIAFRYGYKTEGNDFYKRLSKRERKRVKIILMKIILSSGMSKLIYSVLKNFL